MGKIDSNSSYKDTRQWQIFFNQTQQQESLQLVIQDTNPKRNRAHNNSALARRKMQFINFYLCQIIKMFNKRKMLFFFP